ncbi:MAG: M48 family metalloprotease [Chitinophagales bacterium]|nr:M48 family metalloprotease [Chitinophagales bacterium]
MKIFTYLFLIGWTIALTSCGKINLLTLEDERQLGEQAKAEIASNPQEFPILNKASNPQAYAFIEGIAQDILNSGQVQNRDNFQWEVYIIKRDDVLNAFCTPGGKIYFYTGLMKYLDNSSAVAGVMGHEIAHADRRHSGKQLTSQMGLQILLQIVAGTSGQDIAQMVGLLAGIGSLKFSRDHESEADEYSVRYLCPTKYQTDGAHFFFKKLIDEGQANSGTPSFLSTHPDPGDRVANIQSQANSIGGCVTKTENYSNDTKYLQLRATL